MADDADALEPTPAIIDEECLEIHGDDARDANRDALGRFGNGNTVGAQFPPGTSANPGGIPGPKAELVRELNAHLLETGTDGKTNARRMTEKLVSLAIAGHTEAIKYIEDRIEGKPAQAVTLSLDDGPLHYRLNVVDGGARPRALPPGEALPAPPTDADTHD